MHDMHDIDRSGHLHLLFAGSKQLFSRPQGQRVESASQPSWASRPARLEDLIPLFYTGGGVTYVRHGSFGFSLMVLFLSVSQPDGCMKLGSGADHSCLSRAGYMK